MTKFQLYGFFIITVTVSTVLNLVLTEKRMDDLQERRIEYAATKGVEATAKEYGKKFAAYEKYYKDNEELLYKKRQVRDMLLKRYMKRLKSFMNDDSKEEGEK